MLGYARCYFAEPVYDPPADLVMMVEDDWTEIRIGPCPGTFLIDAAYSWGDDGEGWDVKATLINIHINGQERSREWLADLIGETRVAAHETAAGEKWLEDLE